MARLERPYGEKGRLPPQPKPAPTQPISHPHHIRRLDISSNGTQNLCSCGWVGFHFTPSGLIDIDQRSYEEWKGHIRKVVYGHTTRLTIKGFRFDGQTHFRFQCKCGKFFSSIEPGILSPRSHRGVLNYFSQHVREHITSFCRG